MERNDDKILLSKELKQVLLSKCKKLDISIFEVVTYFGDDPEAFKNKYLRRRSPKESKEIHQGTILKYCKFLGINVTILIQSGLKTEVPQKIQENVEEIKKRRIDKQRIKYGRKDTPSTSKPRLS